jgi:TonB family protein
MHRLAALALAALLLVTSLDAQEMEGIVADTWTAAKPVSRRSPVYPSEALNGFKEGWVMVSFVISPDGEVIEPMIEDSSGVEALELSALRAVGDWRYEPAKRNGEPVEQSMVKTMIRFQIDGASGATPDFLRKFRQISKSLQEGDLATAQPLLDELEFNGRDNLYEDAWFWWLKYVYLETAESPSNKDKITALRRAVGYEGDFLDKDLFVIAANNLFLLEAKSNDLSAARRTYMRLRDSRTAERAERYEATIAALTPTFEEIERIVAGNELLVSQAEIGANGYWVHDLLRRAFSMANIVGRVDVVDVRCEQGTKRYATFPIDGVWRVPDRWGTCGIYIKGAPGTTFEFEEHPAQTAAEELEN